MQGKSVNIYPGDKIMLAGVYELLWGEINKHIAPVGRPTVARNIRGGHPEEIESSSDYSERHPSEERSHGRSRITELMSERESHYSHRDDMFQPIQEPRRATMSSAQLDAELSKWNWGAFFFGWLWGVFNKVYITLIQLVVNLISFGLSLIGLGVIAPIFSAIGLGLSIWFGVKGSRMAWENGAYRNIDDFRTSRHNWNVAAAIVFAVNILLIIILLVVFIDIIAKLF